MNGRFIWLKDAEGNEIENFDVARPTTRKEVEELHDWLIKRCKEKGATEACWTAKEWVSENLTDMSKIAHLHLDGNITYSYIEES